MFQCCSQIFQFILKILRSFHIQFFYPSSVSVSVCLIQKEEYFLKRVTIYYFSSSCVCCLYYEQKETLTRALELYNYFFWVSIFFPIELNSHCVLLFSIHIKKTKRCCFLNSFIYFILTINVSKCFWKIPKNWWFWNQLFFLCVCVCFLFEYNSKHKRKKSSQTKIGKQKFALQIGTNF